MMMRRRRRRRREGWRCSFGSVDRRVLWSPRRSRRERKKGMASAAPFVTNRSGFRRGSVFHASDRFRNRFGAFRVVG